MIDKRLAIVTGGNRGLGFETCRQLGQLGIKVILTGRQTVPGEDAAAQLVSEGLDVEAMPLDVTDPVAISALGSLVRTRFGRCDILINNAGAILDPHDPEDPDVSSVLHAHIDTIRQSMEVNVFGAMRLIQEFIPVMHENWHGRIVNMSSSAGRSVSTLGGAHYSASKAGVLGFTRHLAKEEAGNGITVNAVCPGLIDTEMVRSAVSDERAREYAASFPVPRLGQPWEVAELVAFIASDRAAYMTGVSFDINGGDLMM